MYSRREFARAAFAGVGLSAAWPAVPVHGAKIHSRIGGVYVGIQTFSLRALPRPGLQAALISALTQVGIGECELFSPHAEPIDAEVPDLRQWRLTVSLDHFRGIRRQFNRAGIDIAAYNPRMNTFTDAEIDRTFQFAKALGAKTLNSNLQPPVAARVAPFAEKHKMVVAITQPNAEIFAMSPYFRLCFDIGDATRAGTDAFKTVRDHYDRLTDIHLKDCTFKGVSVPFGAGDSQMAAVLQFLKAKKSPVRARIDCDYPGTGSSVDEVRKCFDYVKRALA